jgi:TRAP-type C4-dicarboxylate transport system permease small subunit
MRRFLSDVLSLLFAPFSHGSHGLFCLKPLRTTRSSGSAFGAPLWIPYGSMALGSTLLVLVLLEQVIRQDAFHLKQ